MKKSNTIHLPRPHISPSQYSLWKRSPKEYKARYFYGKECFVNKNMKFGKEVAEAFECKEDSEKEIINLLKTAIPKYKNPEHEFKVDMFGIPLMGIFDSYDPKTHRVIEYKTGLAGWTQRAVDNCDQLRFYALMIYLKHKVIPEMKLVWIHTENKGGKIGITGDIDQFEAWFNLQNILEMSRDVTKVAKEISEAYEKELSII
jgi:hypothetical protein